LIQFGSIAAIFNQRVEIRQQADQFIRLWNRIEFANGLSANTAARGKAVARDRITDARNEDELQPLLKHHRIHGECSVEIELLWPERFALPQAARTHLRFDSIELSGYSIW